MDYFHGLFAHGRPQGLPDCRPGLAVGQHCAATSLGRHNCPQPTDLEGPVTMPLAARLSAGQTCIDSGVEPVAIAPATAVRLTRPAGPLGTTDANWPRRDLNPHVG